MTSLYNQEISIVEARWAFVLNHIGPEKVNLSRDLFPVFFRILLQVSRSMLAIWSTCCLKWYKTNCCFGYVHPEIRLSNGNSLQFWSMPVQCERKFNKDPHQIHIFCNANCTSVIKNSTRCWQCFAVPSYKLRKSRLRTLARRSSQNGTERRQRWARLHWINRPSGAC